MTMKTVISNSLCFLGVSKKIKMSHFLCCYFSLFPFASFFMFLIFNFNLFFFFNYCDLGICFPHASQTQGWIGGSYSTQAGQTKSETASSKTRCPLPGPTTAVNRLRRDRLKKEQQLKKAAVGCKKLESLFGAPNQVAEQAPPVQNQDDANEYQPKM